ncbi:MAG: hypothetical protein HRF49_12420, partial [bacterium]
GKGKKVLAGAGEPGGEQELFRSTASITGPEGDEFVFEPLDGDGSDDEKGGDAYKLALHEGKDGNLVLDISTNEDGEWKYVLGYVYYDPDKYSPVGFEKGEMFGEEKDEDLLVAPIYKEKGKFAFWIGLSNFDEKEPKDQGQICSIEIEQSPWEPPKGASDAPLTDNDKVFDLHEYGTQFYEGDDNDRLIVWGEVNRGDADLNSIVEISDITRLALDYGKTVNENLNTTLDPLDWDNSGHLDENDVDVMDDTYLQDVDGYWIHLYENQSGGSPLYEYKVEGPGEDDRASDFDNYPGPIPEDPDSLFGDTQGNFWSHYGAVGYCFSLNRTYLDPLELDRVPEGTYWLSVQPFNDTDQSEEPPFDSDELGIASNRLQMTFLPDNKAPVADIDASPTESETYPVTVYFDGSGSTDEDGSVVNYEWDWDGAANGWSWYDSDDDPTVSHQYTSPGSYSAALRVTDDEDKQCDELATIQIAVGGAPIASFTFDPESGNPPLEVSFDAGGSYDQGSGSIVEYAWDWNGVIDGFSYTVDNSQPYDEIDHTFVVGGQYDVWLRVKDNDGLYGYSHHVVAVNLAPVAVIEPDPSTGYVPLDVVFYGTNSYDPDGTITKYEWDWDGDSSYDYDSGANPIAYHQYEDVGDYYPKLRVTDSGGLTNVAQGYVGVTWRDHILLGPVNTGEESVDAGDPITVRFSIEENAYPFYHLNETRIQIEQSATGIVDWNSPFWTLTVDQSGFCKPIFDNGKTLLPCPLIPTYIDDYNRYLPIGLNFITPPIYPGVAAGSSGVVGTISIPTVANSSGTVSVYLVDDVNHQFYTIDDSAHTQEFGWIDDAILDFTVG